MVAGDPAALDVVDGLVAYLDPNSPQSRAARVAAYQAEPTPEPLPHDVLYPPPNYRVAEVAEALRVSPWWVRRRIQSGAIPAYRIGREWRIRQSTLDALLAGGDAE